MPGEAGDNVGCLLRGVERDDVQRGQVLAAPGSIAAQGRFRANMYVLSREEGGRHTPFFPGYRPQFYIRTTDVTGAIELPAGTEMVMPGDNVEMGVGPCWCRWRSSRGYGLRSARVAGRSGPGS